MRLKFLCRFGLLAVLVLAISCNNRRTNATDQQVFHLNYSSGSLESIDPAFAKDLYIMWTVHMVYNTLVETDTALHVVPSLARSWDVSKDGMMYTFHLRDDIYFHNNPLFPAGRGRKMTAADVAYSFSRLVDPSTASPGAWIFNDRIASVDPFTAPDDSTFILRLRKPFRPMVSMLSMPYCSIVPREVVTHWGKAFRNHPCGTGPFRFDYWDEGNVLTLLRNEHYWEQDGEGRALPYLDALSISFVDSKASEFLMFLQGKLDFVHSIDGSFKDLVLRKDGTLQPSFRSRFKLKRQTYLNTEYIGFLLDTTKNVPERSPVRYKLVRQAMNYAIDRQKIVTYFKNGAGIPATGGFTPTGIAGFDTAAHYGYRYDPAKAAELLQQAGFPNGKGLAPLVLLTPENFADIVNFIATQLQEIGIDARIETIQPNILRQQMSRSNAVCFRAQWIADYPDAETYLSVFNSSFPAPPNYTRYNNPLFDRMYEESTRLPDTARWQLYRRMDSIAIHDAPIMPLYYEQLLHFTQNRVQGFVSNPMALIETKHVRLAVQVSN